jgi:hypothetical protein
MGVVVLQVHVGYDPEHWVRQWGPCNGCHSTGDLVLLGVLLLVLVGVVVLGWHKAAGEQDFSADRRQRRRRHEDDDWDDWPEV